MLATIDFEYNEVNTELNVVVDQTYRLMRDGIDLNESVDEAQGEMRQTQTEVDSIRWYLMQCSNMLSTKHIHRTLIKLGANDQ